MRAGLVEFLCCPECAAHPLTLRSIEEQEIDSLGGLAGPDVVSGWLRCGTCERLYLIAEGIPRLLSEAFVELLDFSVVERHPEAFDEVRDSLEALRTRLGDPGGEPSVAQWNLEDVSFWDGEVYGDESSVKAIFDRVAIARPDAGNRTFPRERFLFRHLRDGITGGSLLDIGSGVAHTVRALCHPTEVGYLYIGVELSLSALRTNRRTLPGEFVQCSADRLPFRKASVDAVLMLGTLHHLADHECALSAALDAVRPGGVVALDEVVSRSGLAARIPWFQGLRGDESAHNEQVDPELIRRCVTEAAEIEVWRREYSPVRGLLVARLADPMRTRPWLTRLVIAIDRAFIVTIGRLWAPFRGSELLLFARKRGAGPAPRGPRPYTAPVGGR
jgi:SAM-dependent methyltransferase/uncharacterized protein YbaR (Trm112 family)